MTRTIPETSVGIVEPKYLKITEPLRLLSGQTLASYDIIYETYGELNSDKSNAILICHALSSHHHAAGYHNEQDRKPGWWENCIGPGKPIDTNRFYVVSMNNLGGSHGSTGPKTINPDTGKPYGPDFPLVTVNDWVNSQKQVADTLGIAKWAAVVGGSLGGMQALQWSIAYPDMLEHCLVIAAAPKLTAQNIAFNEVARQAILKDPEFYEGHFYAHNTKPRIGLSLARMLGHITYLSDEAMADKFGRELRSGKLKYSFDVEFQVESYLRYQGESFADSFDANTYLLMTRALDYFDPAADFDGKLHKALESATCKFFVLSFSSDWRFSPARSEEIVYALQKARKQVTYSTIEANQGHDAFLLPIPHYLDVFNAYMNTVKPERH